MHTYFIEGYNSIVIETLVSVLHVYTTRQLDKDISSSRQGSQTLSSIVYFNSLTSRYESFEGSLQLLATVKYANPRARTCCKL